MSKRILELGSDAPCEEALNNRSCYRTLVPGVKQACPFRARNALYRDNACPIPRPLSTQEITRFCMMHAHRLQTLTKRRVSGQRQFERSMRRSPWVLPRIACTFPVEWSGRKVYSVRKTARSSLNRVATYQSPLLHKYMSHRAEEQHREGL